MFRSVVDEDEGEQAFSGRQRGARGGQLLARYSPDKGGTQAAPQSTHGHLSVGGVAKAWQGGVEGGERTGPG